MNLKSDPPKSDPPESYPNDRPISGAFHPRVYGLMAGLALWFVLSSWAFAGGGATDLVLVMVTFIFLIGVGIPSLLSRIRHAHRSERPNDDESTTGRDIVFGNWAEDDVDLMTGPAKGRLVTVEAVLPIAAVAFGMTAFALVLHFVEF